MHPVFESVKAQINSLITHLHSVMPKDHPLGIIHNVWSGPGLTKSELIEVAQSIVTMIDERAGDEILQNEARLTDYGRRLEFLRTQTLAQIWGGNAGQAVSAYVLTLDGLRRALDTALARDSHAENAATILKVTRQLRSMEARLNDLQPRTTSLASMVERIEKAHDTADQLPTDLEALAEARRKAEMAFKAATADQVALAGIRGEAEKADEKLKKSVEDADATLARCESAYSGATSVGLGAAFAERSKKLGWSMWLWVCGLILALVAGALFGTHQLTSLSEIVKMPSVPTAAIVLNMLISMLSIAAPVWFAWMATKQIAQRFRLAEDYAFKASVSRAYEGYRREAARIDKDMETRLLASALTRIDELPLRLVPNENHGSPWHELANSDVVKRAMDLVPNFATQVKEVAAKALTRDSKKPEQKFDPDVTK
jgi:hypothetical protein